MLALDRRLHQAGVSLPLALTGLRMSVPLTLLPFSILDTNKAVGQGHASPAGRPAARLTPHGSGSDLQI